MIDPPDVVPFEFRVDFGVSFSNEHVYAKKRRIPY